MATPAYIKAALSSLELATPNYLECESFYAGTVREVIASRKLRELFGDSGRYYRVNYARTAVDAMLERTIIQGITCDDAGALVLLNQAWDDNELGLEAKDIHRRAYEYGDAYLIAWPDESMASGVSLFAHDPVSVRVFYDAQNHRLKTHAIHTWREAGSDENGLPDGVWQRINMYYPDRVEQWVSTSAITTVAGLGVTTDPQYEPYVTDDAEDGIIDNPFGVVPVFHFRTQRQYGRSELEDAKGPQNSINKANITMMSAMDHQGFPQRYVLTDSALDGPAGIAPPSPWDPGVEQDDLTGLDPDSELPSGPGETWLLSGKSVSVGQFQSAAMSNFIEVIESHIKQMASVTDIPLYYFDRAGAMPSGEALRASDSALNAKVLDREAQFGVTWREAFSFILQVNNRTADAQLAWGSPAVYSDAASWQAATLQLAAGVSLEQVATERGYTPDQVKQWYEDKAAQVVADPTPIEV